MRTERFCSGKLYLENASFRGDHQDVRVAFIFHSQQLILCGAAGTELKWCAGPSDLPFVGHITKLVELAIIIGNIVPWGK